MKKFAGNIIISYMCNKNHNHMVYGSRDIKCDRQNVLSLWIVFSPLLPYGPRNSKFWKNEKIIWRHYHNTNVYHKWQSYDIWLFRYRVQQKIFIILNYFLPFYLSNNPKTKILKNRKKPMEIPSIYTRVPKIMIISYTVP